MIGPGRGEYPGGFLARTIWKIKEKFKKYFSDFPGNPNFSNSFPIRTAGGHVIVGLLELRSGIAGVHKGRTELSS